MLGRWRRKNKQWGTGSWTTGSSQEQSAFCDLANRSRNLSSFRRLMRDWGAAEWASERSVDLLREGNKTHNGSQKRERAWRKVGGCKHIQSEGNSPKPSPPHPLTEHLFFFFLLPLHVSPYFIPSLHSFTCLLSPLFPIFLFFCLLYTAHPSSSLTPRGSVLRITQILH